MVDDANYIKSVLEAFQSHSSTGRVTKQSQLIAERVMMGEFKIKATLDGKQEQH